MRRGLKLSAREVAEECGITESSVYRWEWRGEQAVPRLYERALRDLVRDVRRRQRSQDPSSECTG
jgi:DNA-directed RNA polymerase specialized sigma24 family protein